MTLKQLDPAQRLTIVEGIGDPSDGESLAGQNVNAYPAGALFYVRSSHRMYELRKNLDALVVATGALNVVDGIGSSAVAGRFVATTQYVSGTLSGGTIDIAGFDLGSSGLFQVSPTAFGGTPGFLRAVKVDAHTARVISSSGSDTSTVVVVLLENPE